MVCPGGNQVPSMEDNLKKALTELMILHLLCRKDSYIGELTQAIHDLSGGVLTIVFPYSAIYRLHEAGYLTESVKRFAPDGRRRQYYRVTDAGRAYKQRLEATYARFTAGVAAVLAEGEAEHE